MSVIVSRALPDARDGLKPVHRRILYSMHDLNMTPERSYSKCARVVGDVLGRFHPHGDASVYMALVRMAQPFSMGLMLVDGQGNFGSVDGDMPASMRYTEARMAPAAVALMADIDKDTVDFQPNYDEKELEPVVLPSRIPNLLVNGAGGIAVGMATNIPPHNLGEVVDAALALLDDPQRFRRRPAGHRARSRLPDGRRDHGPHRAAQCAARRARIGRGARPRLHRGNPQGPRGHRGHRTAVPGQQTDPDRADRRNGAREAAGRAFPTSATNPTARGCGSSSS